ncbi:unnamed protein product [Ceratitis capitata]|uniref:(Mediterranean fruit fly) hypothetical protein n=1 Tax=Ceratitis capitata TaxID=7213 RepID=A0A811VJ92_CERCA|nr:unnamed protein product [Ceratitis capitata]
MYVCVCVRECLLVIKVKNYEPAKNCDSYFTHTHIHTHTLHYTKKSLKVDPKYRSGTCTSTTGIQIYIHVYTHTPISVCLMDVVAMVWTCKMNEWPKKHLKCCLALKDMQRG